MILSEGQILFHEGDSGNNLYVVRSGILQGRNTRGDSNTYEAGDLIGELSLLKNEPCPETVIATEDSELLEITPENLNETQEQEPVWFKSIIQFMTGRLSIAQSNKHKSDKIKALPSLLYILDSKATLAASNEIALDEILQAVHNLFNISRDDIKDVLLLLEELEILKVQGDNVVFKNKNVVHLLYETIRYRARYQKMPPQILSMTEQMVLNAVIKTVQQSNEPLKNGMFTVMTPDLLKVSRRAMYGATLTTRTLLPLLQRKLLNASITLGDGSALPEIEAVPFFFGDFDTILDLMELNRIYPLLDKKLV
ncbi:MAG: cyclic nucleotide-binding domain-containing protein [Fibrobacter sp.]|jgi:CRP-like cAMP-binding protein|uniref:Crp/Fnr family transcriptional regulator n=1 Tax=Fibrobacter sp. TaxID=35828 RepID=UPI003867D447|nr:cyclic nucleotide-binding domain-containing protein [Fibrobacter sp.]